MKMLKEGPIMNYPYQAQQFVPNYRPQQQPQYNWNMQMPMQSLPLVRQVSSIDEVKAAQIDFDGSVFYFPDVANKKIYTKSINMDGTVNINLYELSQIKTADQLNDSSYVTKEEFDKAIVQLIKTYESKLQELTQAAAQQQQQGFKF